MLLAVRFKIGGSLRFLSHAETLSLFQRACVRADIPLQYSQGFNPHPKLSLPLPRPVGVASDDELLCLRITVDSNEQQAANQESRVKTKLSAQLPEGCEVLSVAAVKENVSIQPCSVKYILVVCEEYLNDELKATIKRLLASDSLILRRQTGVEKTKNRNRQHRIKDINVRNFLKSINLEGNCIIVECEISRSGSIRVDEILRLLELDVRKLAGPVRRTNVQWQEV